MSEAFRSNKPLGLHNSIVASKRHGGASCGAIGAGLGLRFARNDLSGVVKYYQQMRLGLFVLAFACLFCGLDQVVFDFRYTKEFWTQGNRLSAEYQVNLKQWAREHHL